MKKRIEYEFTADEVAEYVRNICRDFEPLTLNNVGIVLTQAAVSHDTDDCNIIAFCESREAERAEMESEPTDALILASLTLIYVVWWVWILWGVK